MKQIKIELAAIWARTNGIQVFKPMIPIVRVTLTLDPQMTRKQQDVKNSKGHFTFSQPAAVRVAVLARGKFHALQHCEIRYKYNIFLS